MSGGAVHLSINGQQYTVGSDQAATTKLLSFLRNVAGLTGTHYTCNQGGCGACTVVATAPDPASGGTKTFSINACLASVYNCDGWNITTVEGLGNERDGLNVIQQRLVDYSGTQCGFCTPGFIMNMYGLTESKTSWTEDEVERNLDGHICRCTGYRPIIEAFKSITPADIEDVTLCKKKAKGGCCGGKGGAGGCGKQKAKKDITVDGTTIHYPTTVQKVTEILADLPAGASHLLMFGNTGVGITGDHHHDAVICMRGVTELTAVTVTAAQLEAGAAVSISTLMTVFEETKDKAGFGYLGEIIDHWNKVASISVRNLGSWAGNLALKSSRSDFASDLFITLVGCGAQVLIASTDQTQKWVTVESLVSRDMVADRDVILKLKLVPQSRLTIYNNYKVMPRSCTSLPFLNASFRMEVDNAYKVVTNPVLAYGGINTTMVRASAAEAALPEGSDLRSVAVLQAALDALDSDLVPDNDPSNPPPQYRVDVAKAMLYKFLMGAIATSDAVDSSMLTGAGTLFRPTSSAQQTYDENHSTWPLGKPMPKVEAGLQCTGELKFLSDEVHTPGTVYGKFLQSTHANAAIDSIFTTAAMAVPGIVGFISAEDIPGVNDMQPFDDTMVEPMFASGRVNYHGQAIGLLVGESMDVLNEAIKLIVVTYSDVKTPVLTIEQAIENGRLPAEQPAPYVVGDVDAGFTTSTRIIEGSMHRGSQYHFYMECLACMVVPNEGSYDVMATTQWATGTQAAIAQVLAIDTNSINVTVKRIGGGFGGKIDACNLVHTATALAAHAFRKPVYVELDLPTNMTMLGWRDSYRFSYKIGVNDAGVLQAVESTLVGDTGFNPADASAPAAAACMPNCYACPNFKVTPIIAFTDTASNTWARSPSTTEGITCMETAMEHVAREIGMDPLEFRKLNLIPDGGQRMINPLPIRLRDLLIKNNIYKDTGLVKATIPKNLIRNMLTQLEDQAAVVLRKAAVVKFNMENRWRKRGLAVVPMLYPYGVASIYGFGVFVSIYANDGTVCVSHGGTEMGQGINTKVSQVAAYILGCDMDQIRIRPTTTLTAANSQVTGGSMGSNINTHCVQQAAAKLRARLDAVAVDGATWKETVRKAYDEGVALCEYYWNGPDEVKGYNVFGVACSEVELDVLTGNFMVLRTDIIEDAGTSSSPLVDVGQVEGAWTMGQGLFTTEGPVFDAKTGAKLNFDTWHYKPLMGRDIPNDFRVTLLSNAPNPDGVVDSKVTNEAPLSLAFSVPLALREAVISARRDAGTEGWFAMDTPLTVDKLQELCLVDPQQFGYQKAANK